MRIRTAEDSLAISELFPNTEYRLAVRSLSPDGWTDWLTIYFTTDTGAICIVSYVDKSTETAASITLTWPDVPDAEKLQIRWKAVDSTVWEAVTLNLGITSHTFNGLAPETRYLFRIRVKCSGVWSDYNISRLIPTKAAPLAPNGMHQREVTDSPMPHQLSISPNPTADRVLVRTDLEGAKSFMLLNMQGQVVLQRETADTTYRLDLSSLKSGTYQLTVQGVTGERMTDRVVVIK